MEEGRKRKVCGYLAVDEWAKRELFSIFLFCGVDVEASDEEQADGIPLHSVCYTKESWHQMKESGLAQPRSMFPTHPP
jgi:hypothetical protein